MKINIDNLTERELIELNHRIVERLKFLETMRSHKEMLEFSVGERVAFHPRGHGVLSGLLIKYNQKTVTVLTEDGQKWNVSPHLLTKIGGTDKPAQAGNKVIDFKK